MEISGSWVTVFVEPWQSLGTASTVPLEKIPSAPVTGERFLYSGITDLQL